MKTIRSAEVAFACFTVAMAVSSCDNGKNDAESPIVASENKMALTRAERYEAEFQRLVVSSNISVTAACEAAGVICHELSSLPEDEALPLLNQLIDMAIAQPVTETNYHFRQVWYEQLFHVVHISLCTLHHMGGMPFKQWEKLFGFFKRYTDEIAEVEMSLPPPDKYGTRWGTKRGNYLLGLKGDLKTWVHVIRKLYFPSFSNGLTEEQKADIMRRLDEVDKFAVFPPDSPCYEKGK